MSYHKPVMLRESIEGLKIKSDGIYVDVTFGGGGHSRAILQKLKGGKLIAFDQDEDARTNALQIKSKDFTLIQANFRHLKRYLKLHGIIKVDGILADLGVSSHQINTADRGFSTRFDAVLDMRMDQGSSLTARKVINEYSEEALHKLLGMYGEVKNARTLASNIVASRISMPINSVKELKGVLTKFVKKGKESKYFAQVFQAIRIEVNDELKALEDLLLQSATLLNEKGRLVVMSYHSLEDRIVKNFINKGKFFGEAEKDFYGNVIKPMTAVNKKPIEACPEEILANNRARSAKLRIAEKNQNA